MDFKKRMVKEILISSVFVFILFIAITIGFLHTINSLNSIVNEIEPSINAMNNMLINVYKDNIILLDYLNLKSYENCIEYDKVVKLCDKDCQNSEKIINKLIITDIIKNQNLISTYKSANELHHDVADVRNQIMSLHKEELATGKNLDTKKTELLNKHSKLFKKAVNEFTIGMDDLNNQNKIIRGEILFRVKLYFLIIMVLFLSIISYAIVRITKLSTHIIKPINEIIIKSKKFVDGDFKTKLNSSHAITEISELQNNVNAVFTVIQNLKSKNKNIDVDIESKLLRQELLEILKLLKNRKFEKKQTTIKDIKKTFNITHPTVLTRITNLKNRKYITIEKSGRDKFLNLTNRGLEAVN